MRRQQKGRQRAREERRSILTRVISRGEKEGLVLDNWPANRAGKLLQCIRDVHGVDSLECGGRDAASHGRWAEALGREGLCLPATAGTDQYQSFTVKFVRAGLGDDVQCGSRGPAEFGRERVREDRYFLDSTDRHG